MFLTYNIVTPYFHTFQMWNRETYFAAGSLCLLVSLTCFPLLASLPLLEAAGSLSASVALFLLCCSFGFSLHVPVSSHLVCLFLSGLLHRAHCLKPDKRWQKWHDCVLSYAWVGFCCACVCMHLRVYLCICARVSMYILRSFICLNRVLLYICMHTFACICARVSMYIFRSFICLDGVLLYMCMYAFSCISVCICACVGMYMCPPIHLWTLGLLLYLGYCK